MAKVLVGCYGCGECYAIQKADSKSNRALLSNISSHMRSCKDYQFKVIESPSENLKKYYKEEIRKASIRYQLSIM